MTSPTLSERLADTYRLPTALPESRFRVVISSLALIRPLSREDCKALQTRLRFLHRGLFGSDCFETLDGSRRATKVCPNICGRVGWGRNPRADHWHVTDADGATVFRTQNYAAVLRYFFNRTA